MLIIVYKQKIGYLYTMNARVFLGVLMFQGLVYGQAYYGDTLWARDYSSTGAFSCAFSPDGTKLAVAYECMGPMVRIIDVNNGHILWESETPDLCLYSIQFSSNGQYIAIAEELGNLVVVDITIPDTIYNIDTQTGGLNTVDFSPAGDLIYVGCDDGTIRVYETTTGMHHHTIPAHSDAVLSLDVSYNGSALVSGGKDNVVKVWNLFDHSLIHTFNNHMSDVKTVKFTNDQQRILSGSADDMICIFDFNSGMLDTMLMIHVSEVNCIDVSTDGSFAVSGSNDQTAKMINLHNYDVTASFSNFFQTRVYGLAISPDMTKLASANHIGYVIMYNIATLIGEEELSAQTIEIYPNPATDFIQISGIQGSKSYSIGNLNGAVVQTGITSGNIDMSALPAGLYLVKLDESTIKLVKQ